METLVWEEVTPVVEVACCSSSAPGAIADGEEGNEVGAIGAIVSDDIGDFTVVPPQPTASASRRTVREMKRTDARVPAAG